MLKRFFRHTHRIVWIAIGLIGIAWCGVGDAEEEDWLVEARIGGLGLHETIKDAELDRILDLLVKEGVSVIEADTALSDYLNDEEFEWQIQFIKKVVKMAHAKGLKVVWYYPTLEVITPDGALKDDTMRNDHPDWVQRNFDGEGYNFFYGSKAFWVEPDDESTWLCPNTPYRKYYYDRIARLAGTGMDGLWLDVPLFNSIVGKWPCACPYCVQKFEADTGMKFPTTLDFSDPVFRRWILWRHEVLADFLQGIHDTAKQVKPDIRTIIEVVSTDHMINTLEGLDVTYFSPELDIVWEVDAISDTTSMRDAPLDDWLCMFTAYKYCRGISEDRARWAFSYGFREDDAQLVMASVIAAQCNPYETRIPQMTTSVGQKYRSKMFHWLKAYSDLIYHSQSTAPVALLYSSHTRDFIDGHIYGGFYIAKLPPSPKYRWWVKSPGDSIVHTNYLAEYRGWGSLLIKNQIPFDIVATNQVTDRELQRYQTLLLPQAVSLSRQEHALLLAFVEQGGNLIITGEESGTRDEFGNTRKKSLWADLNLRHNQSVMYGEGQIVFMASLLGKEHLKEKQHKQIEASRALLEQTGIQPLVRGDADVYVQTYQHGNIMLLHVVHYGWTRQRGEEVFATTTDFSIPWSPSKKIKSIIQTAPGWEVVKHIPYSQEEMSLNFQAETRINSLIMIETEP